MFLVHLSLVSNYWFVEYLLAYDYNLEYVQYLKINYSYQEERIVWQQHGSTGLTVQG